MNVLRFLKQFKKKRHANPAIAALYRSTLPLGEAVEKMITDLPDMAMVFRKVEDSLLQKTLLDQIDEYDVRMGTGLSKTIDDQKRAAMRQKISSLTLLSFYNEIMGALHNTSIAYALTDALHYEMYQQRAAGKGFAAYLDYLEKRNPENEAQMTPAHKFGNDIVRIFSLSDPTLYFIIAQQAVVISESAGKLVRWVLFDEAIEAEE